MGCFDYGAVVGECSNEANETLFSATSIAVDKSSNLFVVDGVNIGKTVKVFSNNGSFIGEFTPFGSEEFGNHYTWINDIAVDTNENIYSSIVTASPNSSYYYERVMVVSPQV